MKVEMVFHEGDRGKPAVIFIHGLGTDYRIWENPAESYLLGGSLPVNTLISREQAKKDFGCSGKKPAVSFPVITAGTHPVNLKTSFYDIKSKGYPVAAWSQKRPVGPMEIAVRELAAVIDLIDKWNKNGIILVGHSRGGLIAKKYLMNMDRRVKGLITIGTPHRGSSIARLAVFISPLASMIAPLLPGGNNDGKLKKTIKRIIDFLESTAIRELLPGSTFFRSLRDDRREGVYYMSIGGTNPLLFTLYRWRWETVIEESGKRWLLCPEELFSVPDIFEKIIPGDLYPEELVKGMGDGLVTAENSKIEWSDEHYNFPLNHAELLFDRNSRELITRAVDNIR